MRPSTETQIGAKEGRFFVENREVVSEDIPQGIYFGVSVGALNEH